MNINRLMACACAAALIGPVAASAAPVLLIDDFSTSQRVTALPDGIDGSSSEVAAPSAIGGARDMAVTTSGASPGDTTLNSDGVQLGFSNNVGDTGTGTIVYDGLDGDPLAVDTAGLGGVNFLIGPSPYMFFDVSSFESDLFVEITAWDMDGMSTVYSETLPPFGIFSPVLPLADFVNTGASFDWTRVGALQFFVEGADTGYDGAIASITVNAVPLPAAALMLLGGLGGLGLVRSRRRA